MLDKIIYIWYNIIVKQRGGQVKMFIVRVFDKQTDGLKRVVNASDRAEVQDILVRKVNHETETAFVKKIKK